MINIKATVHDNDNYIVKIKDSTVSKRLSSNFFMNEVNYNLIMI